MEKIFTNYVYTKDKVYKSIVNRIEFMNPTIDYRFQYFSTYRIWYQRNKPFSVRFDKVYEMKVYNDDIKDGDYDDVIF